MSFDIFFQPCRFGTTPVKKANPFTGKSESFLADETLTRAELRAVRKVLQQVNVGGPDEFGCYVVRLADGGEAEVYGDDLGTGCMVALRGMTRDLLQFLYDLLQAGNWVMLPAMADAVAITTSPGCLKDIPDDFPRINVCKSAEELTALLADGFEAWSRYRDQVASGSKGQADIR